VVSDEKQDETAYLVLINNEEQYSLWPAHLGVPTGWTVVSEGTHAQCFQYVDRVWTDMRPLSLRKEMEQRTKQGSPQ
jgi:MbtH protein